MIIGPLLSSVWHKVKKEERKQLKLYIEEIIEKNFFKYHKIEAKTQKSRAKK